MSETFCQIYLHFLLPVRDKDCLVPQQHKTEVHNFLMAFLQKRCTRVMAIHCMPDHLHLFVSIKPGIAVSQMLSEIKRASQEFINRKRWIKRKFSWHEGGGIFSYSHSHVEWVTRYIDNQENHHLRRNFAEEYEDFLRKFDVSFSEELFDHYQ